MLSTTAEYALRAMVQLARATADQAVLGRHLAERAGVPPNYLSKILLDLNKAGFVTAVRGSGGGYRLSKPAESIHLIDIVELFDLSRAHPKCLLDFQEECTDHDACPAHERWKHVRTAYVDFLLVTSLADIAADGETKEAGGETREKKEKRRKQ